MSALNQDTSLVFGLGAALQRRCCYMHHQLQPLQLLPGKPHTYSLTHSLSKQRNTLFLFLFYLFIFTITLQIENLHDNLRMSSLKTNGWH